LCGAQGTGVPSAEAEEPPGSGPWELLLYRVPFLRFGMLCLCADSAGRRGDTAESAPLPIQASATALEKTGNPDQNNPQSPCSQG
jgi:hypothetical protein